MADEHTNKVVLTPVHIPNATVGKPYQHELQLPIGNKEAIELVSGFDGTGLAFDAATGKVTGFPSASGNFSPQVSFLNADNQTIIQPLLLFINPDPRSLWRNLPSDPSGLFAKPDDEIVTGTLGEKRVVLVSKRGRSHANTGGYREDDGLYRQYASGWNLVTVADGAGSAHLSRKGSQLACSLVAEYFETTLAGEMAVKLDESLELYNKDPSEATTLNQLVLNLLSGAAQHVHKQIAVFAQQQQERLAAFHATLIFVLFRKYSFGYVVLSFGVGDCPIGIITEGTGTLLNKLDVGEYGGGTRFITMPEIFSSELYYGRFKMRIVTDFDCLILMTDGIYDPKFVVEANLEKSEKWTDFMADLQGNNTEGAIVSLDRNNELIGNQLSAWMDFWSPGNHDDRTLAIVY